MAKTRNNRVSSKKPRVRDTASSARGLRNSLPAVVSAGPDVVKSTGKIAEQTVPFIIKTLFVLGLVAVGLSLYNNRFVEWSLRGDLKPANISDAEAQARAATIHNSVGFVYDSFDSVYQALSGLNYNGFVKVYNAFGRRSLTGIGDGDTMVDFIISHYSNEEILQLKMLLNGAFF